MTVDELLKPGTKVKRQNSDGTDEPEFGVIVHSWWDAENHWVDNYVAFFGNAFPESEPQRKPYILRYLSSSLTIIK